MDNNSWWYRVLSHGQAKLKSVDSTPAIIKSAIVKVTILSGNRDWTVSTIFLRRPPPWQTPRALSNTTLSSCSSQTTEEPSMPLNCRSISIITLHILYILSQLVVFILNNIPKIFFNGCDHFMGLGSSSSTIIICALTISPFLLIIFTTIMATGTLGDLPPQRLHQELRQHRSLSTGLFLSLDH